MIYGIFHHKGSSKDHRTLGVKLQQMQLPNTKKFSILIWLTAETRLSILLTPLGGSSISYSISFRSSIDNL